MITKEARDTVREHKYFLSFSVGLQVCRREALQPCTAHGRGGLRHIYGNLCAPLGTNLPDGGAPDFILSDGHLNEMCPLRSDAPCALSPSVYSPQSTVRACSLKLTLPPSLQLSLTLKFSWSPRVSSPFTFIFRCVSTKGKHKGQMADVLQSQKNLENVKLYSK